MKLRWILWSLASFAEDGFWSFETSPEYLQKWTKNRKRGEGKGLVPRGFCGGLVCVRFLVDLGSFLFHRKMRKGTKMGLVDVLVHCLAGNDIGRGAKLRLPFTSHFTTRGHEHGPWEGSWGCLGLLGECHVVGATGQGTTGATIGRGSLDEA
ncbi:hypothetical protein MTR67_051791 [Solanum verrucosum]|uniref:Uncharacterized protein n=1 Tax=Solanum verrucosum TaxID=315347 RepID=A0AAF0V869_SOLVR|nr:hypothetical protein MTR67_051791 [Solanum verrucosum]